MARYIDADKLCDSLRESYNLLFDIYKKSKDNDAATLCEAQLNTFMECIIRANTQPTADVVEVKYGEWFTLDDCANEGVYCSVCHKKVYKKCYAKQKVKSNYCPNCGAKMDGKDINVSCK